LALYHDCAQIQTVQVPTDLKALLVGITAGCECGVQAIFDWRSRKDMNDYAIAFVKLLNKLCEAQGVPTLSTAQGALLAVLLRELELPGRRKTVDEIMAAADRAITMRPLY
jgi:hypothetical protein